MMVVWGVALLLLGLLERVGGATEGCARWVPSADDGDVCCQLCKPGNHLVRNCGPDPKTLCELCREGTYLSDPGLESCRRCTQCTGVRTETQACTRTSDTVCGCKTGYRCADAMCSSCSQECGAGQQPVANGTCQACPPGTFNHKIHSQCVPWSTRCPQPEQKIVKPGTAVSDIVCDFLPNGGNGRTEGMMVAILVMSPIFLAILAVCILIIWNKKKRMMKKQQKQTITKEPATDTPVTVSMEFRRLVEQESTCCFPQQEQGSSLESVASLESEVKLLTV
ncbi:hypothetical protein ANANG_G00244510 [Anguilla anguilla]|uniref:TNFR-Cys domain-containing protein n=1 Tax=Anguilla anguilla TaxID=7936 RepID=A0A9D3LR79_ANGAN|nr:hypothetical protein ANANG_G00244510 [Anguilla anguilla]